MENHFPTLIWFLGAMQSVQINEYLVGSATYVVRTRFFATSTTPSSKAYNISLQEQKTDKIFRRPTSTKTWDYQKALTKSVITS